MEPLRQNNKMMPPQAKGHFSVARIPAQWYVACLARDLGSKPIAREILGLPLVLFRDARGAPAALLDRCPHRNVPLSLGSVRDGRIECAYHGWQFSRDGQCQLVPGLLATIQEGTRRTTAFTTREQDGLIWVFADAEQKPTTEPFKIPHINDPSYTVVHRAVEANATMHAAIENALDVPHTAFLHRGLFRGVGERNQITVVVRRTRSKVEAEYIGEPRPSGLVGRVLSPSGGVVTHYDRFIMPCIIQVEYLIGHENHVLVTAAATPVSEFRTRLHAVVCFRTRFPGWLLKPILLPFALRIFGQDAKVLGRQTDVIQRFGGEQFTSTELDVIGPHVWKLLRSAERAVEAGEGVENEELGDDAPIETRILMKV